MYCNSVNKQRGLKKVQQQKLLKLLISSILQLSWLIIGISHTNIGIMRKWPVCTVCYVNVKATSSTSQKNVTIVDNNLNLYEQKHSTRLNTLERTETVKPKRKI